MLPSVIRQARGLAVWWIILFALWWLLVGEWSLANLVAGAVIATLAAVAGTLVVSMGLVTGRSIGRDLRVLPSVARAVVVDFVVIVGVLARSIASGRRSAVGSFVRRRAEHAPDAEAASWRAWLTIAATVSPNAYVLDVDPQTDEVVLHDLRPMSLSERPA